MRLRVEDRRDAVRLLDTGCISTSAITHANTWATTGVYDIGSWPDSIAENVLVRTAEAFALCRERAYEDGFEAGRQNYKRDVEDAQRRSDGRD